jgi:hypothetical protein
MIIQLTDGFQHSLARIGSNANARRIIQHRRDYAAGHTCPFGYIEAGYSFFAHNSAPQGKYNTCYKTKYSAFLWRWKSKLRPEYPPSRETYKF